MIARRQTGIDLVLRGSSPLLGYAACKRRSVQCRPLLVPPGRLLLEEMECSGRELGLSTCKLWGRARLGSAVRDSRLRLPRPRERPTKKRSGIRYLSFG